jgi:hypothetical protein
MEELLQEMFQNISSWPTPEKVPYYHIGVTRDPVRRFSLFIIIFLLVTYLFHGQIQVLDSFFSTIPGFKTYSDSKSAWAQSAIQLMTPLPVTVLGLQGPKLARQGYRYSSTSEESPEESVEQVIRNQY